MNATTLLELAKLLSTVNGSQKPPKMPLVNCTQEEEEEEEEEEELRVVNLGFSPLELGFLHF